LFNKNEKNIFFDSAAFSSQYRVTMKLIAMHKVLKTNTVITSISFIPVNLQILDFKEYENIIFNYSNVQKDVFDEISADIKKLFQFENYKQSYGQHWFFVSTKIETINTTKDISLHLPDTFSARLEFDADNYAIILSTAFNTAYLVVNGYEQSAKNFTKHINSLNISEEEENRIAELNEKQHGVTLTSQSSKTSFFKSSLFGKKDNKKSDVLLSEKELAVFDPSILNISEGMSNSTAALNQLIGLSDVKKEIEIFKAKLEYRKKQEKRGIYCEQKDSMHMCFLGSPGTGKTSVARIVTGILYDLGYIKSNKCVEVNGQNLKGGYVGQTAIITKAVLRNARNKVLFIDEAYALFDDFENGYGKEAVAVILKEMEDNRDNMIVIFAGYDDEMQKFLKMNDGLKSRINRYIFFENYSPLEMLEIMMSFLHKRKIYITEDAMKIALNVFKEASFSPRFSNARFVRNFVEKVEEEHIYNVHGVKDVNRRDTIYPIDITDDIIKELLEKSM
jgi:AAA+ superfamily predicted ATPase